MKVLYIVFLLLSSLAVNSQSGLVGTLNMSENPNRSITIYDLNEWGMKIQTLDQLGVPYVDLIDLPSALIDSAKIGKIQAYNVGLYYKPTGFGYKVSTINLSGADLDDLLHMDNDVFIAEPAEVFLIGIDIEDKKAKYLHLFVRERDEFQTLIDNSKQFSDKVITFRFEDLQFMYFR